jgi:hypothetical protein
MLTRATAAGLLLVLPALASDAAFKRTKLHAVEGGKEKVIDVELRVGDDKLVIVERKGAAVRKEIAYTQAKSISYEMAKRRRLGEGAAVMAASLGAGAVVMLTKSKSHWLTIEQQVGEERLETVLRLHKDEYGPAIAALEAKSGKQVRILTEQESKVNPTAGSENVDELVAYPIERVLAALKPAMEKYGCRVTQEREDLVQCKRARGNNEATGRGGEQVTAKLSRDGASTRVKVETGKGFVGRLVKKNWSRPIFEEMKRNLS